MFSIFIRTVVVYAILLVAMRILGKRQLGELEVSELITTILLSEIAAVPITNSDAPILHAIIPLVTIIIFEVSISFLTSRYSFLKNILSSPPSTLIKNGVIDQGELLKNRISPEELLSELRLNGISDPSQVEYAILEQNGLLSVIPKARFQAPTLEQLCIEPEDSGTLHIIISQGVWNDHNIISLGKDKLIFEKYLSHRNVSISDVFLLTVNDAGEVNLTLKDRAKH